MHKLIFSLIIVYCFTAHGESFFRQPASFQASLEDSIKLLKSQYAVEKNEATQSKLAFALGVFAYRDNKTEESLDYFLKSLESGTRLGDYAHFFIGLIRHEQKDFDGARRDFEAVVKFNPVSVRKAEAELQLANIAREQEKWGDAFKYLKAIEKKYRKDLQHPEILYSLYEASNARKNKSDACDAAVKLYTRYPMVTIAKGWNEDLSNIGCHVRFKDQEKRFTQFILTGEYEKYKSEIKFWTGKIRVNGEPHPQEMGFYETQLGRIDLAQGNVNEAVKHFLTAQDMLGRTFNIQMYLGKAYSQTEDYGAAIESYLNAYHLSPRSSKGQQALFQAAFLSYQNLDYDGAARRFEEVAKRTRGKLLLDSKWHMAWIRYLKEDYEGAIKSFTELAQRKNIKSIDADKLFYWRAMSLMRLGFTEQARAQFKEIASQKRLGYYTAAASARLSNMPPERKQPEFIDPRTPLAPRSSIVEGDEGRKPSGEEDTLNPSADERPKVEAASADDEEAPADASVVAEEGDVPEASEEVIVTTWKDPALALRFDRAKDLTELGFNLWARSELKEIEKRTRNHNYLQLLMSEYAKVGEYNRSAYIADVTFSQQREKMGVGGANLFWTYAFPQAYAKSVTKQAKKFDVPPTFVWSVMRGESGFREDIHSPAGAMGLMQLIPPTGKKVAENLKVDGFKREMLLDPDTNIMFGTWYLKRLNKTMAANIPLVVASYNAGPHRVQGWVKQFGKLDMDEFIEHIPYLETRNYVKKILRNYSVYQTLYEKKPSGFNWLAQKLTVKFNGPKPFAENWDE